SASRDESSALHPVPARVGAAEVAWLGAGAFCGRLAWRASRELEDELDRVGEATPVCAFAGELATAGGGDLVELRAPAGRRDSPLGRDEAVVLEPVERGIERALIDS